MSEEHLSLSRYYVLNMLSNLNSNFAPEEARYLQKNINRLQDCLNQKPITDFVGEWKVVWGPALVNSEAVPKVLVRKKKRYVTDHAIFLAYAADQNEYFVGISGTNGLSLRNWKDEDINVSKMVAWPPAEVAEPGTAPGAKVSEGASVGFEFLWNCKDPESGKTLLEFLKETLGEKSATITVGGHSLGGCLTPLMASALALNLDASNVKIQAFPTAGPTPGNGAFFDHLADTLHYYHACYNENDLVPLAWDFDQLGDLIDNYTQWKFTKEKIRTKEVLVNSWLEWAKARPASNIYERMPSEPRSNFKISTWRNEGILGQNNPEQCKQLSAAIGLTKSFLKTFPRPKKTMVKIYNLKFGESKSFNDSCYNFARFFVQMGLQHVTAYNHASPLSGQQSPIDLPEAVRKSLSTCFQRKGFEGQEAWKLWLIAHGGDVMHHIANEVLQWVKIHKPKDVPAAELEATTVDDEYTSTMSEAEFEAAFIGEDTAMPLDALPWSFSPFKF